MGRRNNPRGVVAALSFLLALGGCQTVPPGRQGRETPQEVRQAVISVSGAMVGHPLSEEEARRLEGQVATDPEAQRAIEAITSSTGAAEVKAKYCPIGGEHYAPHVEVCPVHHVMLKPVDQ